MNISFEVKMKAALDLKPHPKNDFYHSPLDEYDRMSLKKSIERNGILEPLLITPDNMIVSGHQRWEIAQELTLEQVPTRLIDGDEEEVELLLVTSNTDRRQNEKNLMKKARQAQRLCERAGISHGGARSPQATLDQLNQDGVAKKLGIDSRTLRRLIKLLTLSEQLQEMVSAGVIGLYAGNDLAGLTEEQQLLAYHMLYSYDPKEISRELVKEVCLKITGGKEEEDPLDSLSEEKAAAKKSKVKSTSSKLVKIEKQIQKLKMEVQEHEREIVIEKLHDMIDLVMKAEDT